MLDSYVDSHIRVGEEVCEEEGVCIGDKFSNFIVTGIAGCGKSFFMRRTFLRYAMENLGYLPVFVELRHLNEHKTIDVQQYIASYFQPHVSWFNAGVLARLMEKGKLIMLFDGFDELYETTRDEIRRQIDQLVYNYPEIRIIVSGRPDAAYVSWSAFEEYSIAPLNLEKCVAVASRAKFDAEITSKFVGDVRRTLFESHKEYLQNPLMTCVMLMTFDQFVQMPEDMSAFYAKSIEVLYSGHDLTKSGGFQRQTKCQISLRDLEAVLGYFCALSFIRHDYDYDEQSAIKYLTDAIALSRKAFDPDNLLEDVSKSYCLLIRDGLKYSYIHRSFQEYLSASCLSKTSHIDFFAYTARIMVIGDYGRFLRIVNEIAGEKLEASFTVPALRIFKEKIYPTRKRTPKKFVMNFVRVAGIEPDGKISWVQAGDVAWDIPWWHFVEHFCKDVDKRINSEKRFIFLLNENPADMKEFGVFDHSDPDSDDQTSALHIEALKNSQVSRLAIYQHYLLLSQELVAALGLIEKQAQEAKNKISRITSPFG